MKTNWKQNRVTRSMALFIVAFGATAVMAQEPGAGAFSTGEAVPVEEVVLVSKTVEGGDSGGGDTCSNILNCNILGNIVANILGNLLGK